MARPKKDAEMSAERRILDAFWRVLESTPLHSVSVRTVAQTADVNRGTFYYHFQDIDALVDRAIENELLEQHSIVHEVLLMTAGEIDRIPFDSMQRHIDRTVLLVRQGGGEHVMNVVFDIFRNIWRAVLCFDGGALNPQVEMLIRYNVHGILGLYSSLACGGDAVSTEDALEFQKWNARRTLKDMCALQGIEQGVVLERLSAALSMEGCMADAREPKSGRSS